MQLSGEPEIQTLQEVSISKQRKRIFSEIVENYTGQKLWESGGEKLSPKAKEVLKSIKERFGNILKNREVSIVTPEQGGRESDYFPTQILYGHDVREGSLETKLSLDEILGVLGPKSSPGEIETLVKKVIEEKKMPLEFQKAA